MLPQLDTSAERIGFRWLTASGEPTTLAALAVSAHAEADRWLPTHLEALDDVLVDIAGRFGEVLGGGRGPRRGEHEGLTRAYVAIDRATADYVAAVHAAAQPLSVRSGQILGTGALMSIRLREVLGMMAPAPFDGALDRPGPGVVGGRAGLHWVGDEPWQGARWLVLSDDGRRLPATLSMLLFESSGVDKDASLTEHREALAKVAAAVPTAADPMVASGAVDWLLFDWVMAHRDGPDSGAVEIRSGLVSDAEMIVAATAASVACRARFDPALM